MGAQIRRVFVEKKEGFAVEAEEIFSDFKESLGLDNLSSLRLLNRYDLTNISDSAYEEACKRILAELPVDLIYQEEIRVKAEAEIFAVEYLPGQYDQRADWAEQCIQILNEEQKPTVRVAQVFILEGDLTKKDIEKIKDYYINPIDSREAELKKPETLSRKYQKPAKVETVAEFIEAEAEQLAAIRTEMRLAMNLADLKHCQRYFKNEEKRNPTITELRVLDTYWSDHCRHTTFLTKIEKVDIEADKFTEAIENAYKEYLKGRQKIYQNQKKDICLMDIALLGMKELRALGKLDDLEISNEVNAASIEINVDVDGQEQAWLLMFKNETHNHPTEIEPFGGAATCLGGAIRDPLSGRAYVYQAMRISGAADPRAPIEATLAGKLPQKKIVQEAANGYSSYGNQIGLATGMVRELYHQRFLAKHLELGAVVAAAPKENVFRGEALPTDKVILLGGKTGRDGCGGATGSSKVHNEDSIEASSAEVQKGNAPTERKIQRLFRKPKVTKKIKVCNDFGAGGVAVAIGELAAALEINLDAVPKKYEGLNGTELAISESQERMAVVVEADAVNEFIKLAAAENLEATVVAEVKANNRLIMKWQGEKIVDLSRDFLATNGASQKTKIKVCSPKAEKNYFKTAAVKRLQGSQTLKTKWLQNLADINIASQKGLVEKFDSSIGAGSVTMPFGGKYQLTPTQAMTAKIPLVQGQTKTGTIMSYGYDPNLACWSPFHGALYAVIESVAKIVAVGGDYSKIRLSLQEYFEKLGQEAERWGKPFSALLGAYKAQKEFGIPAIGGKDSMSGTFKELDVPPTLVSFAVDTVDVNNVISPEFKAAANKLIYLPVKRDQAEIPNIEKLQQNYSRVEKLIAAKKIKSAAAITVGGLAAAISKMSFGNQIGVEITADLNSQELFSPEYGALILELAGTEKAKELFAGLDYQVLGQTIKPEVIKIKQLEIPLSQALKHWQEPLEKIYKTETLDSKKNTQPLKTQKKELLKLKSSKAEKIYKAKIKIAKPKVLIPVFPGTNCEYDTARQFREAGAEVETFIFKNLKANLVEKSIIKMAALIKEAQIVAIPGGFSAGDEPDGSAKFIAAVFRNPQIKQAVKEHLKQRDGLMLGICNGFQALVQLGLLPTGEIKDLTKDSPTLTYNKIGRHVSQMVNTKIISNKSPWLSNLKVGDIHTIPVSHGEGRFVAQPELIKKLEKQGQIIAQYVDLAGEPTKQRPFNPNGSAAAIEAICSPDGRILGKMGHSERIGKNVAKNISGLKNQGIFQAGVDYFKK
ncbi:MAG: phosphoribosylformylglycinamidine synthase [Bacillota bacterium]